MLPHYFLISVIVYGFVTEIRKWIELIIDYSANNEEESEDKNNKELPESIKHLYS